MNAMGIQARRAIRRPDVGSVGPSQSPRIGGNMEREVSRIRAGGKVAFQTSAGVGVVLTERNAYTGGTIDRVASLARIRGSLALIRANAEAEREAVRMARTIRRARTEAKSAATIDARIADRLTAVREARERNERLRESVTIFDASGNLVK